MLVIYKHYVLQLDSAEFRYSLLVIIRRAEFCFYINLYSPTSGGKERNIQTYKYGGKSNNY